MSVPLGVLRGENAGRVVVVPPEKRRSLILVQLARRVGARARAWRMIEHDVALWRGAHRSTSPTGRTLSALLGGVIHYSATAEVPLLHIRRNLELVPEGQPHVGSGGGVRQRCRLRNRAVVLRLGAMGTPADPIRHFQALTVISDPRVPDAISSGVDSGIRWTLEEFLSGGQPRMVDLQVAAEVGDMLAELPTPSALPPSFATGAPLSALLASDPDLGRVVERCQGDMQRLPSVMVHGDLWLGNLLFDAGTLSGVVDWDSWFMGAPGLDLIHLWAEHIRREGRMSYGELIEREFWSHDPVARSVTGHLAKRGYPSDTSSMETLARLWWWTTVSGAVMRNHSLLADHRWTERNVVGPVRFWVDRPAFGL